jgi:hypothetical protein
MPAATGSTLSPSLELGEEMAEGRGFEPPVGLRLRLISSQVPLTTQPPFHSVTRSAIYVARFRGGGKFKHPVPIVEQPHAAG